MKKNLLLFCCGLLSLSVSAQLPYVATPTMIPQNPTPASFIKIATKVTTPSQGIVVDANTFTVTGQQIHIKGCYWQGMLTATQDYIDTLMIGQLPPGNYQIIQTAYLSSTQQHCSKIDSNMATVQSPVSPVTGIIKNKSSAEFNVYPNPSFGSIYISGISGSAEASIFSAGGQLIRKEMLSNKPLDVYDLPDGLYFIQVTDRDRSQVTKFLKSGAGQ